VVPEAPGCSTEELPGTLAWLRFEDPFDDGFVDNEIAGSPAGTVVGRGLSQVAGPAGCGLALRFPADQTAEGDAWLELPASPVWSLKSGSIDFWIWVPVPEDDENAGGVVARGNANGSALDILYWYSSSRLSVRLRLNGSSLNLGTDLPTEEWVHVGINFGGSTAELFANGDRRAAPALLDDWAMTSEGSWLLGVPAGNADFDHPFVGGALDELRISSQRRDFALLAAHEQ
jgi:hypothetical protein